MRQMLITLVTRKICTMQKPSYMYMLSFHYDIKLSKHDIKLYNPALKDYLPSLSYSVKKIFQLKGQAVCILYSYFATFLVCII